MVVLVECWTSGCLVSLVRHGKTLDLLLTPRILLNVDAWHMRRTCTQAQQVIRYCRGDWENTEFLVDPINVLLHGDSWRLGFDGLSLRLYHLLQFPQNNLPVFS